MRSKIQLLAIVALSLAGAGCGAGEPKGKEEKAPKLFPKGPEIEKLKTELELDDAQIAKAKSAVEDVAKKDADRRTANPAIAAAEEEVKKAHEALHAAEDKLKAVRGTDVTDEYRMAVHATLPEDKKEKGKYVLKIKSAEKMGKEGKKE